MRQYLDLLERTLKYGDTHENRTGIDTIRTAGDMMRFNLEAGFPAVTTKKLAFKSVIGELCAFMRASRSAADFRALGSKVWDQNANENKEWLENPFRNGTDDLGPVYGVQWRKWPAFKVVPLIDPANSNERNVQLDNQHTQLLNQGWAYFAETDAGHEYTDTSGDDAFRADGIVYYKEIDQLGDCLKTIMTNPDNRRILFHAWNPAELGAVALAACHVLYQFIPNKNTKKMAMTVYVRSNDLFLGAPFNIASAAVMLELVCRLTGYTASTLSVFIGDCHIYINHIDQVREQLTRSPLAKPKLVISDRIVPLTVVGGEVDVSILETLTQDDFRLEEYDHHPALSAPMAV